MYELSDFFIKNIYILYILLESDKTISENSILLCALNAHVNKIYAII